MARAGVSHTGDVFLALPCALEMSNVHWSELNINVK